MTVPPPNDVGPTNDQNIESGTGVSKHGEYYFVDIVFLVESQLFKVPRRNFVNGSEVFSDMFQLPSVQVDGQKQDGSSDDQPLRLDGIKKLDFLQLLRVMFPDRDNQETDELTLEEWTSVLKLSSMWQFHKIRANAIKKMEKLPIDLVDKIVIAKRFDISTWLVPTLNALIQRQKPLDLSEGNRLGMEWVLKVAEVRERDATLSTSNQVRTCSNCSYTGAPRCSSCSYTGQPVCGSCRSGSPATRCGSCNTTLAQQTGTSNVGVRGSRTGVDYSSKISEVFGLV